MAKKSLPKNPPAVLPKPAGVEKPTVEHVLHMCRCQVYSGEQAVSLAAHLSDLATVLYEAKDRGADLDDLRHVVIGAEILLEYYADQVEKIGKHVVHVSKLADALGE